MRTLKTIATLAALVSTVGCTTITQGENQSVLMAPIHQEISDPGGAQWLRENLPKLRDDAIDHPGDPDKVAAYMHAQRVLLDMAQRFATDGTTEMKINLEPQQQPPQLGKGAP